MRTAWLTLTVLALGGIACSDETGGSGTGGGGGSGGGTAASGGGDASSGGGPSTSAETSASAGGGGSSSTGTTSTGATGTTSSAETGATTSTGGGEDAYAEARQVCLDTINQLRATEGLPPYTRWAEAETCSDAAATSDEQSGTAHGAFGSCGESAQNECLGHGPQGIAQCLQQMWDERLQPGCAGCAACDQPGGGCPDCDFFGTETGDVCGHYVNMRAPYFSTVACGFSALGGWDVQNFR